MNDLDELTATVQEPGETETLDLSDSQAQAVAVGMLRPTVRAAETLSMYDSLLQQIEISKLVESLSDQVKLAEGGDLGRAEAVLVTQAHTLDMLFNHLAQRAAKNIGYSLDALETYLKLSLRAQSQCRATLATLADIKKPDPISLKNTVHGDQQLNIHSPDNNGEPAPNQKQRNGLLEKSENESDEWLDRRAPQAAIGANTDLEAVAEIDRSEVA